MSGRIDGKFLVPKGFSLSLACQYLASAAVSGNNSVSVVLGLLSQWALPERPFAVLKQDDQG